MSPTLANLVEDHAFIRRNTKQSHESLCSKWTISYHCGESKVSQSTLLGGLASSLEHCPLPDSDTICNRPSPSLAGIILFELPFKILKHLSAYPFELPLKILKHLYYEEVTWFPSPTDMRSHTNGSMRARISKNISFFRRRVMTMQESPSFRCSLIF